MDFLEKAHTLEQAGEAFAIATVVRAEKPTSAKPGAKAIITGDGNISGWVGGSCAEPTVIREARKAILDGQARFLRLCPPEKMGQAPQDGVTEVTLTCVSGGTLEIYIEPFHAAPNLVVIGHLATTDALLKMGKGLGYQTVAMGPEATRERFPQADSVYKHIDFSHIRMRPQTYVIVASHGNYDEEALEAALRSSAPYVALVASKARAQSVIQSLQEAGLDEDELSRVRFPAGLDIGAVTPEEIAISILAEIVQLQRSGQMVVVQPGLEILGGIEPSEARDPVCNMTVEIATTRYTTHYKGETYYFCSAHCKHTFEKSPEKFITEG